MREFVIRRWNEIQIFQEKNVGLQLELLSSVKQEMTTMTERGECIMAQHKTR